MREPQRRRRINSIFSCRSPLSASLIPHSAFVWYEEDAWMEVAKYLDGRSLVMLGATSTWFSRLILTEESVWKYVCIRDLQIRVSDSCHMISKWKDLYASAFDGSHSYKFHQQEKHIDWMRIGAFSLDSSVVLLTDKLSRPEKLPKEENIVEILKSSGHCVLGNVKTGIWIADLQLVRCPVCDLNTCDEGYRDGSWKYRLLGTHDTEKHADGASGGIFDVKHLLDSSTSRVQVKYQIMRAGDDGEVVSIRISQQLL